MARGQSRRASGGRAARVAARRAPSSEQPAAAPPGQKGGDYRPLSATECQKVSDAALTILAEIGIGEVPGQLRDLAVAQGCSEDADGRVLFSRSFVEDVIDRAAKSFVLHGQDPKHDFLIEDERVRYGTGGAAVQTVDLETGAYRASTLKDLYDLARLVDTLDNVCWFTRCCVATDVPDNYALDVNTAYVSAMGTSKPIGMSFVIGEHVDKITKMFDWMLGEDGAYRRRPFCKAHISPIVSPLRYGEDAVDVIEACVRNNMPINEIIAAQAGATAPATPAGMLVQSLAETLAGLIAVHLFKPGHPVIFSNWPFVIDLRTGAFSGGGGEIAIMNAAAAQMGNFYGLPSGVSSSMADAKVADAQAGFEKGITALAAGLAGGNMIYESAGMHASLLGVSFESFVIDNEMLGAVQRVIRGIEVNDDTIGLEAIEAAVRGPGHFLGADHTIQAMQRDYFYPDLSDRDAPQVWEEAGALEMRERARLKAQSILAEHYPRHVSAERDRKIREGFEILLPQGAMGP